MKLLQFNQKGCMYLLNMTLLAATYFVVRILPLPFVLYLYGLTTGIIVETSVYDIVYCVLWAFTIIPIQCKLGCMVFYSLQIYWFVNISRSWSRSFRKYVNSNTFCYKRYENNYAIHRLEGDVMYKTKKKIL